MPPAARPDSPDHPQGEETAKGGPHPLTPADGPGSSAAFRFVCQALAELDEAGRFVNIDEASSDVVRRYLVARHAILSLVDTLALSEMRGEVDRLEHFTGLDVAEAASPRTFPTGKALKAASHGGRTRW